MRLLSKIISIVFHPILVPTLFCLVFFHSESFISLLPIQMKFLITIAIFATTFVLPALFMPVLKYYGKISSYEMEDRKERILPMFITCVCYGICFFELRRFPFPIPGVLFQSLIGASVGLLFCLFISMKWKISAHATGMGGLLAAVFCFGLRYGALVDQWFALLVVASGLTFSARLYLQAHTLGQLFVGFVLGFGSVALWVLAV